MSTTDTIARAAAFTATLTPDQLARLRQPHTPAAMTRWSNFPQATLGRRQRRLGLPTATLTLVQWAVLDDLLAATTSPAGLDRIRGHLDADDHLHDLGGRWGYGRDQFFVAFLGEPGVNGAWALQFGGHHLALTRAFVDGELVGATPAFFGIEPFVPFTHDGQRRDPERPAQRALADLLAGLHERQTRAARLTGWHDDIALGPGRDWAFPDRPAGLAGRDLDADQRDRLLAAIAAWVDDVEPVSAARIMDRYAAELDNTQLGWAGTPALNRVGDYVRIDGPSVWIEFSLHDGIVTAGPHPHAVWRDKHTDYGGTRF